VLFLDELAEFDRDVLEALRQPLEDGSVAVARAGRAVRFPARFQLLAATNPCRCGYRDDPVEECRCRPSEAERYLRRVSGPLLDRIDCFVTMPRVTAPELLGDGQVEASAAVAGRIARAWSAALGRNGERPNAALGGRALRRLAELDPAASRLLVRLAERGRYSARATHRAVRVARTVADLRGRERVAEEDVAAAVALREPEGGARARVA
jgi:magnesium chelatase family protein